MRPGLREEVRPEGVLAPGPPVRRPGSVHASWSGHVPDEHVRRVRRHEHGGVNDGGKPQDVQGGGCLVEGHPQGHPRGDGHHVPRRCQVPVRRGEDPCDILLGTGLPPCRDFQEEPQGGVVRGGQAGRPDGGHGLADRHPLSSFPTGADGVDPGGRPRRRTGDDRDGRLVRKPGHPLPGDLRRHWVWHPAAPFGRWGGHPHVSQGHDASASGVAPSPAPAGLSGRTG